MLSERLDDFVTLAREIFGEEFIPLHRPVFGGNETRYLTGCIESNFVSSAGAKVGAFEQAVAEFVGAKHGIATVNGTAALHVALMVAGVTRGDEVLSQSLTFAATCNAISYIGARPVFIDVDRDTLGFSPTALRRWLETHARVENGHSYSRTTGARIAACVPMHTFGLPVHIAELSALCAEFHIPLIEDAAESLGSRVGDRQTGTFGAISAFSFNGNKIITTGGGGMLTTDDDEIARKARHLSTTAKLPHDYNFVHDMVGYNYRMPNLNAALGLAQMERLPAMLEIKAELARRWRAACPALGLTWIEAPTGTHPNNWLNAVLVRDRAARDAMLEYTNAQGVMTRPVWTPMHQLAHFADCQTDGLEVTEWLADRVVNIPSSVPENQFHRLIPTI
ncbi:LegC family aminotransferase [Sagittula sp. S175]|uniref:LegC family aminotransferase n=1 Tax=Sagittula sp. S175 TaxID=3415129 RepID=UPI003C7E54A5